MKDWGRKPTSQKRVTVLKALAALLEIGRQKRLIDKKPPNPNRKQGRKTKRLGLGFFGGNPEPALPLERGIKQFDYCELSSGQVSHSSLVVLRDSVDLVCFCSRGGRSRGLDVHPKTGNSLVGSVYTTDRANLVSSMRIAGKVVSCTPEKVASCTTAILVCRFNNRCRQLICLFASAILNWSVMHLFQSFGKPNRLCELKYLAWLS